MPALETPAATLGWKAATFSLKGTDGKNHALDDVKGKHGLVVMFICNHCPYVKKTLDRIVRDMAELKRHGIGSVAIMSNDPAEYPEDSFENMTRLAREKNFSFPYVIDETQQVAHIYGAVCTPDFFGFNAALELQYRGRLDESWQMTIPDPRRELLEAMLQIAKTNKGPVQQHPSIGCSIKWKEKAA